MRRFLLRGVRNLARLLGCDEAAAVLQYHDVLPYMLKEMAPFRPLADCSNQEAWGRLLDRDVWEAACPGRFHGAASGALSRLIRFYISIEDGECTVERDLGTYREQLVNFNHKVVDVHDDYLLLKLGGPSTAAEFNTCSTGALYDEEEARHLVPDFTRACAGLWRELYGARYGHFNAAATAVARAKRQRAAAGTVRGTVGGVLAAARLSVLAKRRLPDRPSRAGDDSGAGTSRSEHWNAAMDKFKDRSLHFNIPGCSTARAAPGAAFSALARVSLGKRRAAKQPPPEARALQYGTVALLGVDCAVAGCPLAKGRHAASGADLVVVRDLAVLHEVETLAADEDLAVGFLYVVLRGLDVTTKPLLSAAGGRPRSLLPTYCVRHVKISHQERSAPRFWVATGFTVEHPEAYRALRKVAAAPGASVAVEKREPPARGAPPGVLCIRSLLELVRWAVDARRVVVEVGPKALNTSGTAMAPTQP